MYNLHPTTYRGALRMQRACGIAVWRIAPLTMARRALDVYICKWNACAIVYVHVYIICMYAYMAPHCRCVWCGFRDADYPAHMRLRLVLWRMSLLWRAVHVHGPYSYGLMLLRGAKEYAHMPG